MGSSAKESSRSKSAEDVRPDVAGLLHRIRLAMGQHYTEIPVMIEYSVAKECVRRLGELADAEDHANAEGENAALLQRRAEKAEAKLSESERARDADRADAERYRWLRDHKGNNRVPHVTQHPCSPYDMVEYPYFAEVGLDAAIDAAREVDRG